MYSTEASNWFNQSALAAKDGSARPQRTTHERRPDHHDDGGDGQCGDGGNFVRATRMRMTMMRKGWSSRS